MKDFAAYVRSIPCVHISLNADMVFEENTESHNVWLKQLLLHELGHLFHRKKANGPVERELYAQMWAINKAYKLGMKKVAREARHYLVHKWTMDGFGKKYGWNKYRIYILANRLAKKRGLIP